jgi:hypothetical protein
MITFTDKELKLLWDALDLYQEQYKYGKVNSLFNIVDKKKCWDSIQDKLSNNYRANK